MRHGVHPWLSNHGGRQLDGAPSAAETLVEIRQNCPDVLARCDVIVDGGVTRGTDVAKALALGARGVALGRGFLFSLVFGQEGVSKAVRILKSELQTAMGLLGVTSVEELGPSHVSILPSVPRRGCWFANMACLGHRLMRRGSSMPERWLAPIYRASISALRTCCVVKQV